MANKPTDYGPKAKCLKALKVFGDYWTLTILFCLRDRGMRFGEIPKEMSINPVTLTSRLRALTRIKLLSRRKFTDDKQSVTYKLTNLARGAVPIVQLIILFSAKPEPKGETLWHTIRMNLQANESSSRAARGE